MINTLLGYPGGCLPALLKQAIGDDRFLLSPDFALKAILAEAGTPATYARAHGQHRKTREEILTSAR